MIIDHFDRNYLLFLQEHNPYNYVFAS